MMQKYYHVTKKKFLPNILKYGLKLKKPQDSVGTEGIVEYPPCIFIATTPSEAEGLSWNLGERPHTKVMLEVLIPKKTIFYEDPYSYGSGWYITEPILSENIRVIPWRITVGTKKKLSEKEVKERERFSEKEKLILPQNKIVRVTGYYRKVGNNNKESFNFGDIVSDKYGYKYKVIKDYGSFVGVKDMGGFRKKKAKSDIQLISRNVNLKISRIG